MIYHNNKMAMLKRCCQHLLLVSVLFALVNCDCSVNIRDDLKSDSPLLLSNNRWKYPVNGAVLKFQTNEQVVLTCTGEKNSVMAHGSDCMELTSTLTIKCTDKGNFVSIDDNDIKPRRYAMKNFYCSRKPDDALIPISVPAYLPCKNRYFATGFRVSESAFLKVLEVCYDNVKYRAIITYSTVSPMQRNKQFKIEDANTMFKTDQVHKDMNYAYVLAFQKEHFDKVFGKKQTYVRLKNEATNDKGVFFERGHLVPRADFVYLAQQDATYYYVNVAPMWNVINGGNWLELENSIRWLSFHNKRDLKVWTGTLGLLELDKKKVYLKSTHKNADKKFAVEVPKFLYKLVFDPTEKKAIVIITINNPYWKSNNAEVFCNNIIKKVTWLKMNYESISKGYTFACSYEDFKVHTTVVPKLLEVKLLL